MFVTSDDISMEESSFSAIAILGYVFLLIWRKKKLASTQRKTHKKSFLIAQFKLNECQIHCPNLSLKFIITLERF